MISDDTNTAVRNQFLKHNHLHYITAGTIPPYHDFIQRPPE